MKNIICQKERLMIAFVTLLNPFDVEYFVHDRFSVWIVEGIGNVDQALMVLENGGIGVVVGLAANEYG